MLFSRKLTLNREFQRAYRRGKSLAHPLLVTYYLRGKRGQNRIGITTSRKIGGAVERNRARRIILEAYRQLEGELSPGWELVFVARTKTTTVKTNDIRKVMKKHLAQAGILKEDRP